MWIRKILNWDRNMNGNFWVKTGQAWKIKLIYSLVLIEVFILTLNIFDAKVFNSPLYWNIFHFFSVVFIVIVFFSLKCPRCKKNVGYFIVRTARVSKAMHEILHLEKCPECGKNGKM